MNTRKEVLEKAVHDCYKEMYAKAQPSADWDIIIQEFKDGKRNKEERVYDQHYLSSEEYDYIVNKYIDMYRISAQWKDDVEVVEDYLSNGGHKDKYIPDRTDEDGFTHPGYRSYEDVPSIKNQILDYLNSKIINDKGKGEEIANDIANIVLDTIKTCKNYYRFDKEESDFRFTCGLGASPTSNPETVKKYWKEKTGEDIEIELHNPKLFWYIDEGYTDEDLAWEFEEYGENWKEALDKEWYEEVERKNKEKEEYLKKFHEEYNNENEES